MIGHEFEYTWRYYAWFTQQRSANWKECLRCGLDDPNNFNLPI